MSSVPLELETASFSLLEEDISADSDDFTDSDGSAVPDDSTDSDDSAISTDSAGLSTGTSTGSATSLLLDSFAELSPKELEVPIGDSARSSTGPVPSASSPPHAARKIAAKASDSKSIFLEYIRTPQQRTHSIYILHTKKSINEKAGKSTYRVFQKRPFPRRKVFYIFHTNYTKCKTQIVKKMQNFGIFSPISLFFTPFQTLARLLHKKERNP